MGAASTLRLVRAPEDLDLAIRCSAGDRTAQKTFFDTHKRRVHATLYRLIGSNQAMDDLLQIAFINIFRSLRSFRGEASLATWVDRCTVRVAYAHFAERRRNAANTSLDVEESPADEASAEDRVLSKEALRRLYATLDRMEENQRLAFSLHVLDDRPLAEVAEMMEATLEATKTRVFRARQKLEERARKDSVLAPFVRNGATPEEK